LPRILLKKIEAINEKELIEHSRRALQKEEEREKKHTLAELLKLIEELRKRKDDIDFVASSSMVSIENEEKGKLVPKANVIDDKEKDVETNHIETEHTSVLEDISTKVTEESTTPRLTRSLLDSLAIPCDDTTATITGKSLNISNEDKKKLRKRSDEETYSETSSSMTLEETASIQSNSMDELTTLKTTENSSNHSSTITSTGGPSTWSRTKLEPREEEYLMKGHTRSISQSNNLRIMIQQLNEEALKRSMSGSSLSTTMTNTNTATATTATAAVTTTMKVGSKMKSKFDSIRQQIIIKKKDTHPSKRSGHGSPFTGHFKSHSTVTTSDLTLLSTPITEYDTIHVTNDNRRISLQTMHSMPSIQSYDNVSVTTLATTPTRISSDDPYIEKQKQPQYQTSLPSVEYRLEGDIYDAAQSHVFDLMCRDSYPRFIASSFLKQLSLLESSSSP
jgi:hypothetical protein